MSIPDEILMAFADGELEPRRRAEVEAAIAADPTLAERVEQHRALRRKLNEAFDPVLMETVPDSLIASVRTLPRAASRKASGTAGATPDRAATVTDLRRVRAARAAKEAAASGRHGETPQRPWTWFEWAAMAASVAAGAVIAHLTLKSPEANRIGTERGQIVAQADLSRALTMQLASDQPANAPIQIGVSFKSKSGNSCRTFIVREENALGGLACREGDTWHVQVLASMQPAPGGEAGGYKPAGSSMPPAVVAAVGQQIEGEPLDAAGEAAARARGWK